MKEEALDHTMWRTSFGTGFEPVVRQTRTGFEPVVRQTRTGFEPVVKQTT